MDLLRQAIAAIAAAVSRPPALLLGSLLGFGILIPHRLGITFGDSRILLAYAFLPMLFVAAPVAIGMPRARESTTKLYTWLLAGIILGIGLWAIFVTLALVTMTAVTYPVRPVYPGPAALLSQLLYCAASCWFSGSAAAYLAMLFSPKAARNAMRVLFLLVLLWMQFGTSLLSPRWRWYLSSIPLEFVGAAALLLAAGLTNAIRVGVNQTRPIASQ
ncbi:hypothetical protein F183_A00360 [Bryobacterales bacterium F-183]|nr:hypothetical protein F183_A00360 [Bryobacterales bacterium F-183]